MLAFRDARPGDGDPLWLMLEPVFRAGETYCIARDVSRAAALAYWCGAPHRVRIAEEDGRPLGSYFLTPNQSGGGAHVANCGFVTASEAQGRGVARAMLDDALAVARASGFAAMQFNFVVGSNRRAIDLWARAGFETVGRLPGAFRHPGLGPVDALVMYRGL